MIPGCRATIARLGALAAILSIAAPTALPQLPSTNPSYTAQSIVNSATQTAEALAPNTIATIYGTNLAFSTVSASGTVGGYLPESLGGVSVLVGGWLANVFYVSPTQINFLVPYEVTAGMFNIVVARQGIAGPAVPVQLNSTSPGMFVYNGFVIATHLNGTLISSASPAAPGEIIVIYVDGLGRVAPDTTQGRIASSAASITAASQLQVLLAGTACPPGNILYAGLAPGFAGLYQVNLIVPPLTPPNPEIRISVGAQISPPGLTLAAQ
jgi:uncharacterized protein (TIGR03437 family)